MKIRIKIQGTLVFLSLTAAVLLSNFLLPLHRNSAVDIFLAVLGAGIILLGFSVRIAARGAKADISTDGRSLLTSGLYGLVRHPMYLGTFLICSGVILMLFQLWTFFIFLAAFFMIYMPQTAKEEKKLLGFFDKKYKDYCRKTPKYFPRLIIFLNINLSGYLSFKNEWLKKEIRPLIGILFAAVIIRALKDFKLSGYIRYKKDLIEICLIVLLAVIFFVLLHRKNEK